ncbi:hypothetical protein [Clostridium sp. AN503]|uniref:hypothetical protein n=1 Tax=Clostridium sp. AN503 TaxID=3160598 RepID=UPI0034597FD8
MGILNTIVPPTVDDFTNGNLFDIAKKFIDFIFAFLGNLFSALVQFYNTIIEANNYVNSLIEGASSGSVQGLPLLQIIGAYRYLVTDPIFYLTYMSILIGCLFTIYQLVLLLIGAFNYFKKSVSSGGTSEGFINIISKFFHS